LGLYLALSRIEIRRAALLLPAAPGWVGKVFLIDDGSWPGHGHKKQAIKSPPKWAS